MEEPALPRPKRGDALIEVGREDLELFSVQDLAERIEALEAEIGRTRQALERKRSGRSAADALFSFGKA
jgi:uncharacterized small protein (DUF1192 family)